MLCYRCVHMTIKMCLQNYLGINKVFLIRIVSKYGNIVVWNENR